MHDATTRTRDLLIPKPPWLAALLISALLLSGVGCSSMNRAQKGGAIGAGAGAVVGGVIGKTQGHTTRGAVIGGAVGGTVGAIIGRQMDKQAKELEEELEGAEVARVGDGIQVTFDSAILFSFDSSTLSPASRTDLADLAASLLDYPNTEVQVIGHTDAVGTDSYNQALSERRAYAVERELTRLGVAGNRLWAIGMGESSPVADNATAYGRSQNRRVELSIHVSDEYIEQLEAEAAAD